jgi:hypothetical protein
MSLGSRRARLHPPGEFHQSVIYAETAITRFAIVSAANETPGNEKDLFDAISSLERILALQRFKPPKPCRK